MVLLAQQLERYGILMPQVTSLMQGAGHPYNVIHAARNAFFLRQYPETVKFVGRIRDDHRDAATMLAALRNGDNPKLVHDYLLRSNTCRGAIDQPGCRTLVLLDATGSMADLISLAKQTVGEMFKRAFAVLGPKAAGVSMQLGVYRNFNAPDDLRLETTDWESSSEPLFNFLKNVVASYGWGREAVELGVYHAVQQHLVEPISQVIIIGDAPPNTRAESDLKRAEYTNSSRFPNPVYFDDQRAALMEAGVIVHAFYTPTASRVVGQSVPVTFSSSPLTPRCHRSSFLNSVVVRTSSPSPPHPAPAHAHAHAHPLILSSSDPLILR